MKRVAEVMGNPLWLFSLVVGGIVFWAQAEKRAEGESPRSRMPHPASCRGCMAVNLEKK